MEVALWGRIWIRLSSGDPSSSRINALKFFGFTLNAFKETEKTALWMPGTGYLGQLRCPDTGKAAGLALRGQAGEPACRWMQGGGFFRLLLTVLKSLGLIVLKSLTHQPAHRAHPTGSTA